MDRSRAPGQGSTELTVPHTSSPTISGMGTPVAHAGSTIPRIEVAGIVTKRSLKADPTLAMAFEPEGQAAAHFRRMARRLQRYPRSRIIGVTSPNRGEGKTTCAINLALAFAEQQAGEVLLVEASRQNPSLGARLGFASPVCFGLQMEDALRDHAYCYKAVATLADNLHVLAFNPKDGSGPGLLNAPAFENTMRQLASAHHTQIIVDCPCVLGSADINLIQDSLDLVLFAIRARSTRRQDVKRAISDLAPAAIAGTVLFEG